MSWRAAILTDPHPTLWLITVNLIRAVLLSLFCAAPLAAQPPGFL